MRYKYQILLGLFLISLIISLILSIVPTETACNLDKKGCSIVQESKYTSTFGIKNDYYGVIVFLFLAILTFLQIKNRDGLRRSIINIGVIFSSLAALYLIYLQQFVIKAWCTYCLIVDISMLIALAITLSSWRK